MGMYFKCFFILWKAHTVFPRIVSVETILFWIFKSLKISYCFRIKVSLMGCGNYSGVKTIPGRKLFAEMRYWFFYHHSCRNPYTSHPTICVDVVWPQLWSTVQHICRMYIFGQNIIYKISSWFDLLWLSQIS